MLRKFMHKQSFAQPQTAQRHAAILNTTSLLTNDLSLEPDQHEAPQLSNPRSVAQLQRTIGNQAVMRMIATQRKQAGRSPVSKTRTNVVQRVNFDNPGWANAGTMTRSSSGAEGVLFVTFPTGQIIVKFLDQAAGAQHADNVLGALNVNKPQMRFVPNNANDVEGNEIRQFVMAQLNTLAPNKQAQVQDQLDNRKYIQIQTIAQGTGGDKVNADQLENVLFSPTLMREMGRLVMIDAFLGNYDRISNTSINTGNFVFGNVDVAPTLIAIDNDAVATKGSNKAARGNDLKFILKPSNIRLLAQAFVVKMTKLGTLLPSNTNVNDIDAIVTMVGLQFEQGIRIAADEIITMIQQDPAFFDNMKAMEKNTLPGPTGQPRQLLRAETKGRFKMLQQACVANGWDKMPVTH